MGERASLNPGTAGMGRVCVGEGYSWWGAQVSLFKGTVAETGWAVRASSSGL